MTYSIKHLFHIDASQQEVYNAIATLEGLSNWWTTETSGETKIGGHIQFDFGTYQGPKMEVIDLQDGEAVSWECVGSEHGWKGHIFRFRLDQNEGKTRVRFSHDRWESQSEFYAHCNFSWGRYLRSLRVYCETGIGEAFGSDNYQ